MIMLALWLLKHQVSKKALQKSDENPGLPQLMDQVEAALRRLPQALKAEDLKRGRQGELP